VLFRYAEYARDTRKDLVIMELKTSTTEHEGAEVLHKQDWFAISLTFSIFAFGFMMLGIYWLVPHSLLILTVGLLIAGQLVLLSLLVIFRGWRWALAASFLVLFNLYPAVFLILALLYPLITPFMLFQAIALIILGQSLLALTIWVRASSFDDPDLARGVGWVGTFFGFLALVIIEVLAVFIL
jgi:hypothetical protein